MILNKNNNIKLPNAFNIDNSITTDRGLIVNAFNKYFVDLGPNLAKKITPPKKIILLLLFRAQKTLSVSFLPPLLKFRI